MYQYFFLISCYLFVFLPFLFAESPPIPVEEDYRMKYEYKFSFKGPHISHSATKRIPFWDFLFGQYEIYFHKILVQVYNTGQQNFLRNVFTIDCNVISCFVGR